MSQMRSVEIDFSGFLSSRRSVDEIISKLKTLASVGLEGHILEAKGIWDCASASEFLGKEVSVKDALAREIESTDEVLKQIDDEATLMYKIEQLNLTMGLRRNY